MVRISAFRLSGALALVVLVAGCGSQGGLVQGNRQEMTRLQEENAELRYQLSVLRDSLQFYDDIDSGAFDRQVASLKARINRLEYELAGRSEADGELGETIEVLSVDELFEPGSAQLTDAGVRLVAEAAEQIKSRYPEGIIRVEGHTDNIPLGARLKEVFPSNWELSAARASAVARQLEEAGIESSRLEVVAYGATRPAAPNTNETNRRTNRRVRVAVAG